MKKIDTKLAKVINRISPKNNAKIKSLYSYFVAPSITIIISFGKGLIAAYKKIIICTINPNNKNQEKNKK